MYHRRSTSGLAVVVLFVSSLLASCGGIHPGSAPSSAPATPAPRVTESLARAEQPLSWQLSAPTITIGTSQRGRAIAVITKDVNPFIQSITSAIDSAAAAAGMTTLHANPAGSAADVARQLDQAIAQRSAAVITVGFTTAEIAAPLRQAHSAGVAVVQLFVSDPGLPPPDAADAGVSAYVSPCYTCIGAAMADVVIRDSAGRAHAVFIGAPDVGIATLEERGFTDRLAQDCPGCSVRLAEAPIAQWSTQIPAIAASAAADPTINYVVPVFDTAAPLVTPALAAAGATSRVALVSSNGDQESLREMTTAARPRWAGNVGVDGNWIGWAAVDQALRVLTDHPALPDEQIGFRVFTPGNTAGLSLAAPPGTWYGATDVAAHYRALWGLS